MRPLSVALPQLCQRLFLTRFRRTVFGPQTPSFLVRFWAFCARRAAAFSRFERARGTVPLRFPVLRVSAAGTVFLGTWLCHSSAKGLFLEDSDAPFSVGRRPRLWSVFGPSALAVPLRFPVLRGSALGTVFLAFGLLFGRAPVVRGCATALPKAFSYRIQTHRFRSADALVFGPFLGLLRAPCLCVSMFCGVRREQMRQTIYSITGRRILLWRIASQLFPESWH